MSTNPLIDRMADNVLTNRLSRFSDTDHSKSNRGITTARPDVPRIRIDDPHFASIDDSIPSVEFVSSSVDATITAGHSIETSSGRMWVHGNSLLCPCPKCNAPMTVRVWLQLADCWRCDTSIALTEEQLDAAKQLMGEQPARMSTSPAAPIIPQPDQIDITSPFIETEEPLIGGAEHELEQLVERSILARLVLSGFQLSRVWIVSFLLHLIAILILALIVLGGDSSEFIPRITISTFLDSSQDEGGEVRIEDSADPLAYDLPDSADMEVDDRDARDIKQAQRDAQQLLVTRLFGSISPSAFTVLSALDKLDCSLGGFTELLITGHGEGFTKYDGCLAMSVHSGLAVVSCAQVAVGLLVFEQPGKPSCDVFFVVAKFVGLAGAKERQKSAIPEPCPESNQLIAWLRCRR